ncbi:MAG: type III pantothenate kinase [Bacteroidota bacterium]|nr:type III pantothenate kinase [Bacteroidota bacterium]MDP4212906.1 type III pantothenate kinase [Bacteroidota bacterium]MDP4249890.1 type III pantothenate kinase [Bacteroidota bacterium]
MLTTLCFDFGNTRLKYAVFEGADLKEVHVLKDDREETIRSVLEKYGPVKTILSSVIDHNPDLEQLLTAETRFHKLNHHSMVPVTTPVGKPETIGADRLALVVGASHFYPGRNNLVIGLGSAITYNYINRFLQFLGGSISPGMEMRFKSLETFTAKLPLINPHWNFPLVGYDTKTNIQSGVIVGMAKEIDGIIEAYEERYENLNVLMTGGDAQYFMPFMKKTIITDPDLIFKGLYVISEFNP